jgi:FKBP-type peptidyl-prolyl cis-trans isomerase SlyD
MQITDRKVVTLDYTLTDDEGEVLDTSKGDEPLVYLHGTGSIVPGLETALEGKSAGDALQVKVAPAQGYGDRDEELVASIPRDRFPSDEVVVGMQFEAEGEDETRVVTVVAVDEQKVTIDANHPLAGVTLSFDVKVLDVRDATLEELTHGHVHGPGGHH